MLETNVYDLHVGIMRTPISKSAKPITSLSSMTQFIFMYFLIFNINNVWFSLLYPCNLKTFLNSTFLMVYHYNLHDLLIGCYNFLFNLDKGGYDAAYWLACFHDIFCTWLQFIYILGLKAFGLENISIMTHIFSLWYLILCNVLPIFLIFTYFFLRYRLFGFNCSFRIGLFHGHNLLIDSVTNNTHYFTHLLHHQLL